MTPSSTPEILLTHLDWTIQRLHEILQREKTPYYRDAALQRFGLTYDMALRCLDAVLQGNEASPPAEAWGPETPADWQELTEAYNKIQQLLKNEAEGDSKSADEVFHNLDRYHIIFQKLYRYLHVKSSNALS